MPASSTQHQAAQEAIAGAAAAHALAAWPTLDIASLNGSIPQLALVIAGIVRRYGLASAALGVQQYAEARATAGIVGAFTPRPAAPPELDQIGAMVRWATQPLWAKTPAVEDARRNLAAGAERLVLDPGRRTVIDNVQRDRHARGWARVPEAGACSFCALLATRGAVYKQDTAGFRSHNNCRCHPEPVFTAYEPTAQIREWQRLYQSIPHGSPAQMRKDFRAALEGRA